MVCILIKLLITAIIKDLLITNSTRDSKHVCIAIFKMTKE